MRTARETVQNGKSTERRRVSAAKVMVCGILSSLLLIPEACAHAPGPPITCHSVITVKAMQEPHFSCVPIRGTSARIPLARSEAFTPLAAPNRE
jgi:hypothetical protein